MEFLIFLRQVKQIHLAFEYHGLYVMACVVYGGVVFVMYFPPVFLHEFSFVVKVIGSLVNFAV